MKEKLETRPTTLNGKEIKFLPATTLRKIGVEAKPPESKLFLLDDPLEISRVKDLRSQDTIYFAFLQHPFMGEHFIQLLNAVAPFPSRKDGVLADFHMPHGSSKFEAQLNKGHESDPEIGNEYVDYVKQNLESWVKCINRNDFDSIFEHLELLKIFNEARMKFVFSSLFSNFKTEVSQWDGDIDHPGWKKEEFYHMLQALERFNSGFLSDLKKFKDSKRTRAKKQGRKIDISPGREPDFGFRYDEEFKLLGPKKQAKIILQYLKILSKDQKEEFVIVHTFANVPYPGPNVFLKKRKTLWSPPLTEVIRDVDIVFPDDFSLELKGENGEKIEVAVSKDSSGLLMDYRVSGYHFPQTFLDSSLYPVIAWRKNPKGERKFLDQSEADPLLPKRADVYLGRVLAAYLLKKVTEKWEKVIELAGSPRPQFMMGAQMPVWVSLSSDRYPYARQLLSDENKLFPKLEQFAQSKN